MKIINNVSVKRTLKPLMPLCASALILMSSCNTSTPKADSFEPNVETVASKKSVTLWDMMKDEKIIARFLLGFGIGFLGITAVSKVRTANKIIKEKEQAEYRDQLNALLNELYYNKSYFNPQQELAKMKDLLKKPLGYDKDAKNDLGYLIALVEDSEKNNAELCGIIADLPMMKFLVDKITSTPEEWENNRNRYPNLQQSVLPGVYAEHINKTTNLVIGLDASMKSNAKNSLRFGLNELKKELFEYGVYDPAAFQIVVQNIDGVLAALRFGSTTDEVKGIVYSGILFEVGKVLGAPSSMPVSDIDEQGIPTKDARVEEEDLEENDDEIKENTEGVFSSIMNRARATVASSSSGVSAYEVDGKISFKDVGGQDSVIEQLNKKVLYPILYPKGFDKFRHFKPSRGIVLHGPTGTGKSLLALALANEANVPFFNIDCTELIDSYVGSSEKNLRNLFKKAIEQQPCIMFFDEIDSIARKRTGDTQGRHDDKLVNQFLKLLNDVEKNNDRLYIIAATNRLDILDPAILRGKRLATHIEVAPPDTKEAVEQILDLHLRGIPVSVDFQKQKFVGQLLEMKATGAVIAEIVPQAFENAYEREGIYDKMAARIFKSSDLKNLCITDEDFEKAIALYKNANTPNRKPVGFNK